jgi:hypothetical protein
VRARAAIDLIAVPGLGAEIMLTFDGEMRKTRLFRSHEKAELVGAIADTRTLFEVRGWARCSLQEVQNFEWECMDGCTSLSATARCGSLPGEP